MFPLLLIILLPLLAAAQPSNQKLAVAVTHCSAVFKMNGVPTVYYEVGIENFTDTAYELSRLDILETTHRQVLKTYMQDSLRGIVAKPNPGKAVAINPGDRISLFVELQFATLDSTTKIANIATLSYKTVNKVQRIEISTDLQPSRQPPLVLGSPVGAGIWTAVYDPAWERGHRRVMFGPQSSPTIPGRFAIDFIKMNDRGNYSAGNEDSIQNWYGYGEKIFAVADGEVATVNDSFAESASVKNHPIYSSEKATGNYVSIRIGNNVYAFYEHLKPGSIQVREGQRVKKGDVIAALGFTGQSTGPHLHFHVADTNSPLGAQGLAFVFERFEPIGYYPDFSTFGKNKWSSYSEKKRVRINERPMPNQVISF